MDPAYAAKPDHYYTRDRSVLLDFMPPHAGVVLDIGCAEGWFGKALLDAGRATEVWGVEAYPAAAAVARRNLTRVIGATVETAIPELPAGHFDCLCFNDVLEHLADPYTVLARLRATCKPGGLVVASIPNILHFETLFQIVRTRDWAYQDFGILDRTHLRFFTRRSMERMFREAGYTVERITGINPRHGRKWALANFLSGNRLAEMKYVQMVVQARS